MTLIDNIIQEYARMRENGLDVHEALRALRLYVEPLTITQRETLAQLLRAYETQETVSDVTGTTDDIPAVSAVPAKSISQQDAVWVECPSCGAKNRKAEVFCYRCGEILDEKSLRPDTRHFQAAPSSQYSDEFFGSDSLLALVLEDYRGSFELRPQMRGRELVIGRSTPQDTVKPDVDLTPYEGATLGVSRLHLALMYDGSSQTIQAYDLGSSNGTFINGQKLHPNERRALRHGDQVRLGRLKLQVWYHHPGDIL